MEMNVLISLLLFYCHRLFLKLLEHLCKVKPWSWALWKDSVIARNSCVGCNLLLQCLKQHSVPPVPISRLLWVCDKDQQCLMEPSDEHTCCPWVIPLLGSAWWHKARPAWILLDAKKKKKRKEKTPSHWLCCPQGCCLLMPWHSACSHLLEIGCLCPFLEGILTFILCLR